MPMKIEQTECSETSAYKLQTPGNYPKESIQHTEHGESLKSRTVKMCFIKQKVVQNIYTYSAKFLFVPDVFCHVDCLKF